MKLFRYLSIFAAATLALTSCEKDDTVVVKHNTAPGVGVSVEQASMIVNEAKGLFEVPLVVTGEPNGFVTVKVKITGTDDPSQDQAIADSHFYVTSETVNIPADTKTASVEIRTQYFEQRDPDLYFRVVIESAVGATIEPLNTCTIAIQDRESSPIYSLAGPWTLTYNDWDGAPLTAVSTLEVLNEEIGQCQFTDFCPSLTSGINLEVVLRKDDATGDYNMSIPLGTTLLEGVSFTGLGVCDVIVCDTNGKTSGEIPGTWNSDHTSVSFSGAIVFGVFSEGSYQGAWERLSNMVFSPNNL